MRFESVRESCDSFIQILKMLMNFWHGIRASAFIAKNQDIMNFFDILLIRYP